MRRMLALAALTTFAASAASAETWTKYVTTENGVEWQYDSDYAYVDKASRRLVVLQAASKGGVGPAAPGQPNGVGSVVAVDCAKKDLIQLGSYSPKKPLELDADWRKATPKKAAGADNEALLTAVCPHAAHFPVK